VATDRWPVITFEAHDIRSDQTAWTVDGTLTVKDTSCPVRLDVAGFTIPADGAAAPVDLRATGHLDRRSAGVTAAPAFVVGHLISLSLAVRLCPPATAQTP
jgi:polyisoprenoid-binding protein YceI